MRARLATIVAASVLALALSGCAYKPLKAPCSPDEGDQPLAYADVPPPASMPEPLRPLDTCGPMKPI